MASNQPPTDVIAQPELDARLDAWLRGGGVVSEGRRVVHASSDRIVVSKVRAGFVEELDAAIEMADGLFDARQHHAWYAAAVAPHRSRPETWRLGLEAGLREYESAGSLDSGQRAEIMAGVDSVAAILETVIWTSSGEGWQPSEAERNAFRETMSSLKPGAPLFAREYGRFENRRVVNFCPGARYAIRLLELGWRTCTGEQLGHDHTTDNESR